MGAFDYCARDSISYFDDHAGFGCHDGAIRCSRALNDAHVRPGDHSEHSQKHCPAGQAAEVGSALVRRRTTSVAAPIEANHVVTDGLAEVVQARSALQDREQRSAHTQSKKAQGRGTSGTDPSTTLQVAEFLPLCQRNRQTYCIPAQSEAPGVARICSPFQAEMRHNDNRASTGGS